jgi:hypothetical protein
MTPLDNCVASWNDRVIAVTAHLVPRYAWTSATIDVEVGNDTVLGTGGVLKVSGKHVETFELLGTAHTVQITWDKAALRSLPFSLHIDGAIILGSRVPVANWWLGLWPWAIFLAFLVWWAFS